MNVRQLREELNKIIARGGSDLEVRFYKDATEYFGWECIDGARESTEDDHNNDSPFCVLETF